jgi:hypothetical protein
LKEKFKVKKLLSDLSGKIKNIIIEDKGDIYEELKNKIEGKKKLDYY